MPPTRIIVPVLVLATIGTALVLAPGGAGRAIPAPEVGKTANLAPLGGTVRVREPGTGGFIRLTAPRQVPFGTAVDTLSGTVRVTTARGDGRFQSGVFSGGQFKLQQMPARRPITDLILEGRSGDCRSRSARGATAVGRASTGLVLRRLRARARGRFRTRGRYSAATVRGTAWVTKDRCDGTVIEVSRGAVSASDLGAGRLVRAGNTFIAWCSPSGDYCKNAQSFGSTARLRIGTFSFSGLYTLCVTAPDRSRECHDFRLGPENRFHIRGSTVRWERRFPNRGPGIYRAVWKLGDLRLGPRLPFRITR